MDMTRISIGDKVVVDPDHECWYEVVGHDVDAGMVWLKHGDGYGGYDTVPISDVRPVGCGMMVGDSTELIMTTWRYDPAGQSVFEDIVAVDVEGRTNEELDEIARTAAVGSKFPGIPGVYHCEVRVIGVYDADIGEFVYQ